MKRNRFHIHKSWGTEFYNSRYKIKLRFAFFPKRIDGKWTMFSLYYSLHILSGAVRLGDDISLHYRFCKRSKSLFGFKDVLKKNDIILNNANEKRKNLKLRNTWPSEFKNFFEKVN